MLCLVYTSDPSLRDPQPEETREKKSDYPVIACVSVSNKRYCVLCTHRIQVLETLNLRRRGKKIGAALVVACVYCTVLGILQMMLSL